MSLETPQNMSTSVRLHVIKRQQPSHICTKTPSWVSSAASFQALRLPLGPFPPTSKLGHWWLSLFWPSRDHEGVTSQTSCHTDTHQTTRLLIFGGGQNLTGGGRNLVNATDIASTASLFSSASQTMNKKLVPTHPSHPGTFRPKFVPHSFPCIWGLCSFYASVEYFRVTTLVLTSLCM